MMEGGTWRDYFKDTAKNEIQQVRALLDYAAENGITLTEEEVAAMWNVVQNIDAGKTVKFALSIDGGSVKTYYTINQIYTIHDSESGEDNAIGFSAYLNANQSGGLLSVELNVTLNNSKVDSIATVCVHSENIND